MMTVDMLRLIGSKTYQQIGLIQYGKEYMRNIEEVELMQYTGLKDETGKEIYEGDILTISLDNDPDIEGDVIDVNVAKKCFVTWDEDKVGFVGKNSFLFQHLDRFEGILFKVIGNIYENPDLLT